MAASQLCEDPFGNRTWPEGAGGFCFGTYDLSVDAAVADCLYLRGNIVASGDQRYDPWRLRVLAGDFVVENGVVQNLVGFDELALITGDVRIANDTSLRMIKGFTKLQCVGGRFLLTTLPSLVAIHAFQSLGVVADSITGPPQSDAAFAIRGTAIKTLWNFWSLMRVGAPLDLPFELIPLPSNSYANIASRGQPVVIRDNPFLTTLDGLQNLYLLALPGDNNETGSDFGLLVGDFGPCGFLSTQSLLEGIRPMATPEVPPGLVFFQRNRTYGLCHYPSDFIDEGNAGTFNSLPFANGTGPCRPGIVNCEDTTRAVNQGSWWWPPSSVNYGFVFDGQGTFGSQQTNHLFRMCQVFQNGSPLYGLPPVPGVGGLAEAVVPQLRVNAYRSYVCAPTAFTALNNVFANQLGSFFKLALATGLEDVLSSPASRVTVMAPTDYALQRTFNGVGGGVGFGTAGLLSSEEFARKVARYAVGFAVQPLSGAGDARAREGVFGTLGLPFGGRLKPGLAISTLDCALPNFECEPLWVFAAKAAELSPFSRSCNLVGRPFGDAELSLPGRAVGHGVQPKRCVAPSYGYAPWVTNTTKGPDFEWVQRERLRVHDAPTAAWNSDVSLPEISCANGVVYAVGEFSEMALAPPRRRLWWP